MSGKKSSFDEFARLYPQVSAQLSNLHFYLLFCVHIQFYLQNAIPFDIPVLFAQLLAQSSAVHTFAPPIGGTPAPPVLPPLKKKTPNCIHKKQPHLCKICGGSSLCKHGVQKNQCKPCGGKGICPHKRVRWQCRECGGASICPHGRRKHRCKDCGSNAI